MPLKTGEKKMKKEMLMKRDFKMMDANILLELKNENTYKLVSENEFTLLDKNGNLSSVLNNGGRLIDGIFYIVVNY